MALSNWDTCAWDHEGRSCNGVFVAPSGVWVAIYKNWINVHDREAWLPGRFSEPVIMQVNEGRIAYRDLNITAVRGPQDGIYAAMWSGTAHQKTLTGIVAIGVYGFASQEWVGVVRSSLDWLQGEAFGCDASETDWPDVELLLLRKMPAEALRFNQGDAYFADRMKEDPSVTCTPVGQADPPVLLQALEKPEDPA